MTELSSESVRRALAGALHPELGKSLTELGMIGDIDIKSPTSIECTLLLPFDKIPIRDDLIKLVKTTLTERLGAGVEIQVQPKTMNQTQRASFLAASQNMGQGATLSEIGHVIAIMSGKGGVGKSSVTSMLAVTLQRQGHRVGILDADITGPSIPKMFGVNGAPEASPLGIIPAKTQGGIHIMSINLLLPNEDDAVIWRGPLISSAIKQFWGEVFWGDLDYLLVDLPPGTSDAALTVMQSIPLSGVILVTSPQDLAGMVVRKAAHMAQQVEAPILGLVENMSYAICPGCGKHLLLFGASKAQSTANQIGVPLLASIPIDAQLAIQCDAGQVERYYSTVFDDLAKLVTMLPDEKVKRLSA